MFRTLILAAFVSLPVAFPAAALEVATAVLRVDRPALLPISRLDLPPDDLGFAGAMLGNEDNLTTGQFLGTTYSIETRSIAPEDIEATVEELSGQGIGLFVVLGTGADVLAVTDAAGAEALVFNAGAGDNELRGAECRATLLHTAPSRSMRTDAVAQFLMWKQWPDWVMIHGSNPDDLALAESYRQSAEKFRADIVEEREFEDTGGARRTDTGYVMVQRQIPVFTQDLEDHDVVVAADETDYFAVYLPYHLWEPRPVAGSAGLRPLTWHPAHEAYGATQFQTRFEDLAGRHAREEDYQVWLALRVIGEAVTRTSQADPASVRDYALGDAFELAAFKGQKVTFRDWDGQLRQPILLADGRLTVSISPQDGYLHQVSPLDTLGTDRPESACTAFQ